MQVKVKKKKKREMIDDKYPIGISFKTQLLYAVVFLTRYLDLVIKRVSIYNTVMKLFFIASSLYILYLMRFKYKATYDAGLDTFRIEYLLVGSAILGLASTYVYTVIEVNIKKKKRVYACVSK